MLPVEKNKNAILLRFCSFVSDMLDVEVEQIYPVRGHSYGQCDTLMASSDPASWTKTPEEYHERIEKCRLNPGYFELMKVAVIYDWEKLTLTFIKGP